MGAGGCSRVWVAAVGAALLLCACASAPPQVTATTRPPPNPSPTKTAGKPLPRVPFRADEYRPYAGAGSGSIEGRAFLGTGHGKIGAVSGTIVVLSPVTSYSRQWYEQQYVGGQNLGPRDPRVDPYVRKQKADDSGGFRFTGLPAGDYYLVAPITWDQVSGGRVSKRREVLAQMVTVGHGPSTVDLSR